VSITVKAYLKIHKNTPILKTFLIENIITFTRNLMQCAYKCAVVKLLKKSIIISILRAEDTDCVCFSKKKKTGIYVLVDKAS
jgi:hypothetical protein